MIRFTKAIQKRMPAPRLNWATLKANRQRRPADSLGGPGFIEDGAGGRGQRDGDLAAIIGPVDQIGCGAFAEGIALEIVLAQRALIAGTLQKAG